MSKQLERACPIFILRLGIIHPFLTPVGPPPGTTGYRQQLSVIHNTARDQYTLPIGDHVSAQARTEGLVADHFVLIARVTLAIPVTTRVCWQARRAIGKPHTIDSTVAG